MRIFIGIRIPDEIKDRMADVSRRLRSKVREARLVIPANLHITLKFLGEVPEDKIPCISGILSGIAKDYAPFKIEVKGAGVFPDDKSARVFWIGADSGGKLKKLNSRIEDSLEPEGFKKEGRFKEHITIARFKSTPRLAFIDELVDRYRDETFGIMHVGEIELIMSDLKPSGPAYTTVSAVCLKEHLF